MDQKKKNRIKKIAKRRYNFVTQPVKRYLKNNQVNMNDRYARYYEDLSIIDNTILFEVRDGQSFTDSPYAMYRQMVNDARFSEFKFYWVYSDKVNLKEAMSNLPLIEQTEFVKRNSDQYLRLLASVNYLITNSTFQSFYTKKEGQIYINTWHGTPLKTMGFDIPDNPFASQNVLRNFLMADYLISPNAHTTKMYLQSYKLDGLYDGQVLESGYPRIDLTIDGNVTEIYAKLSLANVTLDYSKKTILYTPTWKGTNLKNPQLNIEQMIAELNYIHNYVEKNYNFLVKVHPFVYSLVKEREELSNILIPDYLDANEMMAITDILITDYSSIFFDFLATNKPILFYSWDKESYSNNRGMYFEESQLPGPVLATVKEIVNAIDHIDDVQEEYANAYQEMKEAMVPYDDGLATERYIDAIFFNQNKEKIYYPTINKDKYRIILFPSTLKNNGITTSAINLLNNIDYDKYDVTVFAPNSKNSVTLNNLKKINPNARLMFRFGWPIYKINEIYQDKLLKNRSLTESMAPFYPEKAYQRECRRLTGASHFNASVDFSGYSYYWTKFMAEMNADKKIIYQHNDLYAEAKARFFIDLRGVFSLYQKFDVLLSVSPTTRDVNRAKLKEYAPSDKFQYCINSIDINRILSLPENKEEECTDPYHLSDISKELMVTESGEHFIVSDLTTMTGSQYYIEETEMLKTLMQGYKGRQKYYKVMLNNIYIGWIAASDVKPYEESISQSIVEYEELNDKVSVSNINQSGVYKDIDSAMNNNMIYSTSWLRNIILTATQRAEVFEEEESNDSEVYLQLYCDDHYIGWVNQKIITKAIEEEDIVAKSFVQSLHSSTFEEKWYLLTAEQNLDIYQDLHDLMHQKVQNIKLESTILRQLGVIYQQETEYVHLILDNGHDFWVDKEQLNQVEEKDYIVEKANDELKQFAKEKVHIYYHLEDYINSLNNTVNDYTQFVNTEDQLTVLEKIIYPSATLYKCHFNDEQIYVLSTEVEDVKDNANVLTDINGQEIEPISESHQNLITMGRLSNEKNQATLIEAVSELMIEQPEWQETFRLYILGDGGLRNKLLNLIKEKNLSNNVIMLGQKENPFSIMKQCDCFILPSLYEGQPMVLLEALTLGMDTIATDIPSNRYVLENGKYGLMIPNTSPEAIKDSIKDYFVGNHQFAHFDYEEYNQQAIDNFYEKL